MELKVDARGHVSLSFRKHRHEWYFASEDPDGTIHLVPAVLVPARLKEPDLAEAMTALRESFPDAEEINNNA